MNFSLCVVLNVAFYINSTRKARQSEFLLVLLNTLTLKNLPVCARKASLLVVLVYWIRNFAAIG